MRKLLLFVLACILIGCAKQVDVKQEEFSAGSVSEEGSIEELLNADSYGELSSTSKYYDEVKANIVYGGASLDYLNTAVSEEYQKISGLYTGKIDGVPYTLTLFSSARVVVQHDENGYLVVEDGTYTLEDGKSFITYDIANGGGQYWQYAGFDEEKLHLNIYDSFVVGPEDQPLYEIEFEKIN